MKTPLTSLALLLAAAAPATAAAFQDELFLPPVFLPAGSNPLALESGDMNGDGLLDMVRADRGTPDVFVYFGDGLGGLSLPVGYDGESDTRDLRLGDLDGDGDLDVATVAAAAGALFLFLNDGTGDLSTTRSTPIPSGVQHIDMADLDHDGDIDLCMAMFYSGRVDVMLNDGSANFAFSSSHALPLSGADVELVDLDEDGSLDMAVTGNASDVGNAVYVFLGDGAGGFGPRADYDAGSDCTAALKSADFDGDGHADVALGTCAGLSVLAGDGTGALGAPVFLSSSTWPAGWAAVPGVGDFDGDGRPELVGLITDPGLVNDVLTVFSYDPPLGWEIDGDFEVQGAGAWGAVLAADFDVDGFPDLVVGYANHIAHFAHTALDCNQNGLFDPEELEDGVGQDFNENGVLDDCELLGTPYCVATPNSGGAPASIRALGSGEIAVNDLLLVANAVAPNQLGYFMMSQSQAFLPPFGHNQGYLCLGPPAWRVGGPHGEWVLSGPEGVMIQTVPVEELPPQVHLAPGDVWNFQLWFRDGDGKPAVFNTSDAVEVMFR